MLTWPLGIVIAVSVISILIKKKKKNNYPELNGVRTHREGSWRRAMSLQLAT